ncbi:MAG: PKD domain-containing protein [Candidatus Bipolaricaulota bacterium]|nr:PKD domain-containing protein [Candidatus Bipolaricaulota bacterium]
MNPTVAVIVILLLGGLLAVVGGVFTTNSPPKAGFIATPPGGKVPLVVEFDATSSSDPDGDISSYQWDFGDGEIGSDKSESHTYEAEGIYSVSLTVRDDRGATDTLLREINVSASSDEATGDTAGNGFLNVTLRGVRSEPRIGVWESGPQSTFAIVDLKAEAIRDDQTVRDLDFRIVDSENRVYYPSGAMYSLEEPFADSLLARGEWTDGEIAFKVYPASHYMLKYDKRNQPPIEFRFSLE